MKQARTHAYLVPIFERVGDDNMHMMDVYVPIDDFAGHVRFTDEAAAENLGLDTLSIPTRTGHVTPADGYRFLENLWKRFVGNTHIFTDGVIEGSVIAPSRPKRVSPRGEPKIDPMEDIEGQYQRFQERPNE